MLPKCQLFSTPNKTKYYTSKWLEKYWLIFQTFFVNDTRILKTKTSYYMCTNWWACSWIEWKTVLSKDTTYFAQIRKVCFSGEGLAYSTSKIGVMNFRGVDNKFRSLCWVFCSTYMYAGECLKIGNSGLMSFTASQYAENSLRQFLTI